MIFLLSDPKEKMQDALVAFNAHIDPLNRAWKLSTNMKKQSKWTSYYKHIAVNDIEIVTNDQAPHCRRKLGKVKVK